MEPTNVNDPEYFHKVVDCQYACPAHTPVPEYIRLIAEGRYTEAYMINWDSNVFPGVLGRTCDRPCEPACRRGRIEQEPVAICRLKRVAADNRDDVIPFMPQGPFPANGKKVALIGGGPASLTVARDLAPLGYEVHLFDEQKLGGGFMRSQIPAFRLPEKVLNDEVDYVLRLGIHTHFQHYVSSLKETLAKDYDAVFVGTGAPRGRDLPDPLGGAIFHYGTHVFYQGENARQLTGRAVVLGYTTPLWVAPAAWRARGGSHARPAPLPRVRHRCARDGGTRCHCARSDGPGDASTPRHQPSPTTTRGSRGPMRVTIS